MTDSYDRLVVVGDANPDVILSGVPAALSTRATGGTAAQSTLTDVRTEMSKP